MDKKLKNIGNVLTFLHYEIKELTTQLEVADKSFILLNTTARELLRLQQMILAARAFY